MASNKNQEESSYKTKKIITIIFLLLTFVMPLLGIVGVVFMWLWMKWKTWVKVIITLPFFLVFVFAPLMIINYLFVMRPIQIQGEAMLPHYKQGQYYITKVISTTEDVKRGDVVVFTSPSNPDVDYFKRIIALPYEKLMIQDGKVYVNGTVLDESTYLLGVISTQVFPDGMVKEGEEITIPANSYFVMGDNRERSSDSRVFGAIPRDTIKSRLSFCYVNCK